MVYTSDELFANKIPSFETVIHTAFGRSYRSNQDVANSLAYTAKLFSWLKENASSVNVINISSQGCYNNKRPLNAYFSEETPVSPESPYGMAKYASELLLNEAIHAPHTNLRLASLTGGCSGLKPEVISKFVMKVINGENISIVGGGKLSRIWMYMMQYLELWQY